MSHSFNLSCYNNPHTAQKLTREMGHFISYIKTVPPLELTTCNTYVNKTTLAEW